MRASLLERIAHEPRIRRIDPKASQGVVEYSGRWLSKSNIGTRHDESEVLRQTMSRQFLLQDPTRKRGVAHGRQDDFIGGQNAQYRHDIRLWFQGHDRGPHGVFNRLERLKMEPGNALAQPARKQWLRVSQVTRNDFGSEGTRENGNVGVHADNARDASLEIEARLREKGIAHIEENRAGRSKRRRHPSPIAG
jgi:hypothetical protein